jgi:hypothetical protein
MNPSPLFLSFFLFCSISHLTSPIMAILVMRTFILPQEVPNENLMMFQDILKNFPQFCDVAKMAIINKKI